MSTYQSFYFSNCLYIYVSHLFTCLPTTNPFVCYLLIGLRSHTPPYLPNLNTYQFYSLYSPTSLLTDLYSFLKSPSFPLPQSFI